MMSDIIEQIMSLFVIFISKTFRFCHYFDLCIKRDKKELK